MALGVKSPPANAGDMRHGINLWAGKTPWRRARQPPLVFLPGESPWTEEPGGLSPWGRRELDTTEQLTQYRISLTLTGNRLLVIPILIIIIIIF